RRVVCGARPRLWQRGDLGRGQRDVEQADLVDLTGEEVEVGLQAADPEAGRRAAGARRAGRGGLLRAVDVEHHRPGGRVAGRHHVVKGAVVDVAGRLDRGVGV